MRGVKKINLPKKVCLVCSREFTWRKKWRKDWQEVLYCSKLCKKRKQLIKSGLGQTLELKIILLYQKLSEIHQGL